MATPAASNDSETMSVAQAVMTRFTAAKLTAPAATVAQIEGLLAAAARAPDHGRLEPWCFIVLEGSARDAIARSFVAARLSSHPDSDEEQIAREAAKAYRAPTVIVVAGKLRPDHKVPEQEQLLAVGAAIENLLLAAHAEGLGAAWKTGAPAYDPALKEALGLSPRDPICGFVYIGALAGEPPALRARTSAVLWRSDRHEASSAA